MHSTLLLEARRFLRRNDLDTCQLLSKQMRHFVCRNAELLALRSIADVGLVDDSPLFVASIDLIFREYGKEDDELYAEATEYREFVYEGPIKAESFERLFALLYLLDRAELVNIRVGTADIEHGVDYAVADFFARRMKPQCYSTSLGFAGNNALARLSLFGRAPFRDCVEVLSASEFEAATVVDKRLEQIQLQWTEWDGFPPCTPLLRKPTATNVPIPKNNFVKKGFILDWGEAHESECALYSFDNSAAYRRLSIYNWVTSAPSDEMKHDVHAFLIELKHL